MEDPQAQEFNELKLAEASISCADWKRVERLLLRTEEDHNPVEDATLEIHFNPFCSPVPPGELKALCHRIAGELRLKEVVALVCYDERLFGRLKFRVRAGAMTDTKWIGRVTRIARAMTKGAEIRI
jgi:hypothetical protein